MLITLSTRHRYFSIFGVFFSGCFKKNFNRSHILNISLPYFTSLYLLTSHSDLKNHNVFCKRNKFKVTLHKTASVQYNYWWIIANKNWLKRIVNITFRKICSNLIFAASFHRACIYLCLNFRRKDFDRNTRDTEIVNSF